MPSSPAPSHSSQESIEGDENDAQKDHTGALKGPVVKDKECQYCHQKFTSSSLGRHLDQFISKKKPDGIHNVDEIRRLRGGITRRTARSSQKKEQDETHTAGHSPSPQYTLPSYSELVNKTATKEDIRFNRPTWQATGVITDAAVSNPPIPTVASPPLIEHATASPVGQKRSYSTYAADASTAAAGETIRALELSLREVLDAVRMATKKAAPAPRPFEFDIESQTFPFLCLAILQPPPTLFQSTPFATSTSIPLSPPGADQYQALRVAITSQIDMWKWTTLSYIQRSSPPGTTMSEDIDQLNEQTQAHTASALAHLDAAYHNFMSYGAESRHNLWIIELLRAFRTEQQKTKDAKAGTQRLTQEMNQLQQQLDHLSRCQWPREMALWPPERPTFDSATQDELRKINVLRSVSGAGANVLSNGSTSDHADEQARNNDRWDYERLISKWRKHVRDDRARKTGVQPALSVQPSGPPAVTSFSDQSMNSPKPLSSIIPRASSSLYRAAAAASAGSDLTSEHRQTPAGMTNKNIDADDSPRIANNTNNTGSGPGYNVNGTPPTRSGSACHSLPTSTQQGGAGSSNFFGSIPPPPRSRPLGIISDVDEYYAPRLMGFRRDPPPSR